MSIDMTEVRQLFFEESFESLDTMESNLLDLQVGEVDKDLINSIFRVVHSIKGGAGIFKFEPVINFAHTAETLLDEIRSGEHLVTQNMIDTLLDTVDVLRMMLNALQNDEPYETATVERCLAALHSFLVESPSDPFPAEQATANAMPSDETNDLHSATSTDATTDTPGGWQIVFRPYPNLLKTGNDPINLFHELNLFGTLTVTPELVHLPAFHALDPHQCYLGWILTLYSDTATLADIEELFEWVEGDCELLITPLNDESDDLAATTVATAEPETVSKPVAPAEPVAAEVSKPTDSADASASTLSEAVASDALTDLQAAPTVTPDMEPDPVATADSATIKAEDTTVATEEPLSPVRSAPATAAPEPETSTLNKAANAGAHAQSAEASSIRVSIDKIDDLINIVGELVITQSMLDQVSENFDLSKLMQLRDGLSQLERNTRELQESVMRIRMLPISYSFNRFPRLVHDLSVALGKKVELRMSGEHTELDKTVLEKISDPLVHLVRNALDHGIEKPSERKAAGKPEQGLLHLHAFHQGGNIMIQISDDGAGFDMERIQKKAVTLGLINPDEIVTEDLLYEFIFHPGFSTAVQISDLSGRGVGMDVVRRNIRSLGGSIEIRSQKGKGTTFSIRLPLTLAILDGQLVRVGREIYILSLLSIVESLRVTSEQVNSLAGKAEVYKLRDDYIPVLRLYSLFGIDNAAARLEEGLLVIVEGDGQKIGLFVDELLSQQQIVIKSLETNYKFIAGISGATILGDGSVALILDVAGLIKLSQTQHKIASLPPRHLVQESNYEYQH